MIVAFGLDHRRRVVSLWDMLKLHAVAFTFAVQKLAQMAEAVDATARVGLPMNTSLSESNAVSTVRQFAAARAAFDPLPLPLTKMSLDRLIGEVGGGGMTFHEVRVGLAEIAGRLEDELKGQTFFAIEPDRAEFLADGAKLYGDAIAEAFPSSDRDLTEAARCFALERYTACVMHLMRALETPLEAMAAAVGVPAHDNWNKLLGDIENAARGRTKAEHGQAEEQWFQEAAGHLRLIKNAWRNHAMHKRESYSEQDARELISHVGAVLRHLSTRLAE